MTIHHAFPLIWATPGRPKPDPFATWKVDAASIIRSTPRLRFRVRRGDVADLAGAYVGRPARLWPGVRRASTLRAGGRCPPHGLERHGVEARSALCPPVRRGALPGRLGRSSDISASLRFGPDGRTKADRVPCKFRSPLLATAAIQAGDRAGLALVSDRVEAELAPSGGPRQLARLVRALVATPSKSRRTALAVGLERVFGLGRGVGALVVVLSDFLTVEPAPLWKTVAKRHDVVAVRLIEPREETLSCLPDWSSWWMPNSEPGGRSISGSKRVREAYKKAADDRSTEFQRRQCASSGVTGLDVSTVDDPLSPLIRFFASRAWRRGGP